MIDPEVRAIPNFIPALKYHFLTPLYDVGIRFTMPEMRMKRALLRLASIGPGFRVLDVGCGTGTLLLLGHQMQPEADWIGIDPDVVILDRANRKLRNAKADACVELGSATNLPFADDTIDRVLSTLVIHHLDRNQKAEAFREFFRVLKEGGELHIADFGPPTGIPTRITSILVEHVGGEHVQENFRGELLQMIANAGFLNVRETDSVRTIFGTVRMLAGAKSRVAR